MTAPGKGVPNIVFGVNHKVDVDNTSIFQQPHVPLMPSLLSGGCRKAIGVVKGHLETIHAYTNDQNLVDNMHSKYRRGRAAALNMVITETGAGKAVTKAIPS